MLTKKIINSDTAMSGIYYGKVLLDNDNKYRAYIPGLHTSAPLSHPGITLEKIKEHINDLPTIQWCAYNKQSCDLQYEKGPYAIAFEEGDIKRPVVISHTFIAGASTGSSGTISLGSSISNTLSGGGSLDGRASNVQGVGVINIKGPVNDSRNTIWGNKNIEDVPQTFSIEFQSSGEANGYLSSSARVDSSNTAVSSYIISNGGMIMKSVSNLGGATVGCFGNAVLVATTRKFGPDGHLQYVHFRDDDTGILCLKVDEKHENPNWDYYSDGSYHLGPHANEWGHWSSNASTESPSTIATAGHISILEIYCTSSCPTKKIDYIVDIGDFSQHLDLINKSADEVTKYIQQNYINKSLQSVN